jgi:hypothetical protein
MRTRQSTAYGMTASEMTASEITSTPGIGVTHLTVGRLETVPKLLVPFFAGCDLLTGTAAVR